MTKQRKYLLFAIGALVVLYVAYKIILEVFWIVKDETVKGDLKIEVAVDQGFFGFQDNTMDKYICIKNEKKGAKLKLYIRSSDVFDIDFYTDTLSPHQTFRIRDSWLGSANRYNYNTLELVGGDYLNRNTTLLDSLTDADAKAMAKADILLCTFTINGFVNTEKIK